MKKVLITGATSGLGLALAHFYLENGYNVYGIGRRDSVINNKNYFHIRCDLSQTEKIKEKLEKKLKTIAPFHIVYLNAGVLGDIKEITKLDLEKDIKPVLDLNLFANKELLDILSKIDVKNIIAISSGAAVNGSKGWGSYSLSKASLNMLINLYAKEMLDSKLLAVAPGVIKTPMVDIIVNDVDDERYPSAKTLKSGEIQTAKNAAKRLHGVIEKIERFESGSFIDVRSI